ncbi:hypothetical protein AZI86_10190 [Bdellovibrio bacteriovorus]|uniref:C-type lysozyme inhibitor domain-containing protein n=1 Tax=Bdellovibrio bacteriovorus TaxID=959 RepID=A0A150WSR0_BDEBC|nr:hypothetical protein [Bdellovibrio bacteriovorus]KYG67354.1 hypothetical protein AZI86_10190 [Bdellovibrio bacteriovorus]
MRPLLALIIVLSSSSVFAKRYGRDERVYTCVSSADSAAIGANQAFDVQLVDLNEITITRKIDGAFINAPANQGYYFLFGEGRSNGELLAASDSGYINAYNDSFHISIQTAPGRYTRGGVLENCKETKIISEYEPMTTTEKTFEKIGNNASLGNGGYEFTRFDGRSLNMSEEKNELIEEGQNWEQCTWEMVEDFPTILKLIAEHNFDKETAEKIKRLSQKTGITHAIAYVSDSDVSCSNTLVRLYSEDNIRFELYYKLGD